MNYVLIKNGKIVNSDGIQIADLLIGNDKIIEIAETINRPDPETPVIDATGKYVMPGAIDTNRTFSEFGSELKEQMEKLGRSEVIGGTTCMIETLESKSKLKCIDGIGLSRLRCKESLIDFGFHLCAQGWPDFSHKEMNYCYAHEGITSFFVRWPFDREDRMADFEQLLLKAKSLDLLLIVEISYRDIEGTGYLGMRHTEESIHHHLQQLKLALDKITEVGCQAYFLNISFKEELDLILETQKRNDRLFAELTMPCLIGEGMEFVVDKKTVLAGFLLSETLSLIPYQLFWSLLKEDKFLVARPSLKLVGIDDSINSQAFNRPDEFFVLKNALSVLFTSGVVGGELSIIDFCKLVSERPARLMGIYPQKGVLRPGSDADIIIWDPDVDRNLFCSYPRTLRDSSLPSKLKGKAQFVFVNGILAYDGEVFFSEKLRGKFLYRNPQSSLL